MSAADAPAGGAVRLDRQNSITVSGEGGESARQGSK